MSSSEKALGALRTQVQFELAESAAKVARAAALSVRALRQVFALTQHCQSTKSELHAAMSRAAINPALVQAMRRLYQAEHRSLDDARARLAADQQREHEARTALAGLRNRDRSLERALQTERRKRQLKRQAVEMTLADDLWLQQTWAERT